MNQTYVVQQHKGCYHLIPGTLTKWAKCSMTITNPDVVKQYAADYQRDYKYVLADVELSTGEFIAYGEAEIISFRIHPLLSNSKVV